MSVYFATCREANAVKIGSSVDPFGRLPEIQLGCPLLITIEAILPGNYEQEFEFHRRFEEHRVRGEWFTICEMIESIIARNPAPQQPQKLERTIRSEPQIKPPVRKPVRTYQDQLDIKRYNAAMAEMRAARGASA